MATNFGQRGDILTLVAPDGGFTSGVPAVVNDLLVIPMASGVSGTPVACAIEGVWAVPKANGTAFAQGAEVYWDAGAGEATDDTSELFIGRAAAAAGGGAASVSVKLTPGPTADFQAALAHASGDGSDHADVATATAAIGSIQADLADAEADIAALGAEVTDGHMAIPLLAGVAQAGTWTKSVMNGVPAVTRTAHADAHSYWVEVPIPARTTASKGVAPKGLRCKYNVATATVEDVRFELWKLTQGNQGQPAASAVLFGEQNAHYDEAHDTAAERGAHTGDPELHTAVVTNPAPAYLGAGEQLVLRVFVDGDAGAAGVVSVQSVDLLYNATLVDLA